MHGWIHCLIHTLIPQWMLGLTHRPTNPRLSTRYNPRLSIFFLHHLATPRGIAQRFLTRAFSRQLVTQQRLHTDSRANLPLCNALSTPLPDATRLSASDAADSRGETSEEVTARATATDVSFAGEKKEPREEARRREEGEEETGKGEPWKRRTPWWGRLRSQWRPCWLPKCPPSSPPCSQPIDAALR